MRTRRLKKLLILLIPLVVILLIAIIKPFVDFNRYPYSYIDENQDKYTTTHKRLDPIEINTKNTNKTALMDGVSYEVEELRVREHALEYYILFSNEMSINKGTVLDVNECFDKEGLQPRRDSVYALIDGKRYKAKNSGGGYDKNQICLSYLIHFDYEDEFEYSPDMEIILVLENYVYTTYERK